MKSKNYGLIGVPRVGKDTVAKYLQETRGFTPIAFADQIKEEFGVSKGDFEAAKISGQIDKIRQDLWEFSQSKTKNDPEYFIRPVINKCLNDNEPYVITDVRTPEELNILLENEIRVYWITEGCENEFKDDLLLGSKLPRQLIDEKINHQLVRMFLNDKTGLCGLINNLETFFFKEDILEMKDKDMITKYLSQYQIIRKN